MNLTTLLEMTAAGAGDRIAVGNIDHGLSYRALHEQSTRLARQIVAEGHGAIGYLDVNSPDFIALLFGCATAGVPLIPVNYRWTDTQIVSALSQVESIAVYTGQEFVDRIAGSDSLHRIEFRTDPGNLSDVILPVPDQETVAVLLFTSGTSGAPKAAILRNRNLVPYVISTVDFLNADPDEAILVSVPPYHIAAVSAVITSVYAGRRIVQLPNFDAEEWVTVAAAERVTQAMVVPTMLGRILDVLENRGEKLPGLRHLSYGGGKMPNQVIERALKLLPSVDLVNAYGLTETSSTITVLTPDDHREAAASDDPAIRARLGSVGRALPSVDIEVRSSDGATMEAGQAGEIWVRGEQVSGEYLTHSALGADGWYPTRDNGHLDSDGYLFLHGRADDIIVRGGENFSPGEIEDRLREHPAVADVAVVGIPDVSWGERVEAAVVLVDDAGAEEGELRVWVRDGLRSSKVPARIHIWNTLPYNETGKLLRREVRSELTVTAARYEEGAR